MKFRVEMRITDTGQNLDLLYVAEMDGNGLIGTMVTSLRLKDADKDKFTPEEIKKIRETVLMGCQFLGKVVSDKLEAEAAVVPDPDDNEAKT